MHTLFITLTPLVFSLGLSLAVAQCPIESFTSTGGGNDDLFGRATALDGDRLLVGAPNHDLSGTDAGAAYIFERTSGGSWVEVAALLASDGGDGDQFGTSVALSGDLAVVGAYTDSPLALFSGSAYVFERTPTGNWVETAKLVPSDGGPSHLFGVVAIGGPDEILVGAPQAQLGALNPGAVYLFRRTTFGWFQAGRLTETTPVDGIGFGNSVDVSGDRVAIGASPVGAPEFARTIVFDRSGLTWIESASIALPGGAFADLEGTRMLVASPYDSSVFQWTGVVRVFDLIAGSWVETALIIPEVPTFWGLFYGLRFALSGERFIVSSKLNGGTLYPFENGPAGWTEVGRVSGPPDYQAFDALALAGERLLVSASYAGPGNVTEYLVGPTEEVYCDSLPSSTGAAAHIFASTCNAVAENQFSLRAQPVPNQPGLFYYGTQATQVPFGAGFRCVGGTLIRLPVQTPQGGALSLDVDLSAPPSAAGQITAGSTWHFQAWFRDPGGSAAFNLSDAIAVRFL